MVIYVAGASTWLSICSQWGIENICFIAILTLYPQECSILPIFTSRFETVLSGHSGGLWKKYNQNIRS